MAVFHGKEILMVNILFQLAARELGLVFGNNCNISMYDEVDSMLISVNVPKNLVNVSNGRLRKVENYENLIQLLLVCFKSNLKIMVVNLHIGDYVSFSEVYQGEKGPLNMSY